MRVWRGVITAVVVAGLAACGSAGQGGGGASSGTVAAAEQSVRFTVDGTITYGTLDVPAHRRGQRLAAALLLAGSGPTDRNGDQPPGLEPHTLQLVAGVLGRMGIMTLRFDKYLSGQTGAGAFTGHPSSIDLAAFIKQADAAYAFLHGQPAAGGRRQAGRRAQRGRDVRAAGRRVGLAPPITAATARQNGQAVRRAIADFRAGRAVVTDGMLPAVVNLLTPILLSEVSAAYVRSDARRVNRVVAARLPHGTRVLVTEGTADQNVPPSTITPLVRALAAAGATGPGLRLLSGVNHLLHPPGAANDDQVLAASVVTALQTWARPYACARTTCPAIPGSR